MSNLISNFGFTVDLNKPSNNFCRDRDQGLLMGTLGEIKMGDNGEYVVHPYGADFTASELYSLHSLLTELNRDID